MRIIKGKEYTEEMMSLRKPIIIEMGFCFGTDASGNCGNGYIHISFGWLTIGGTRVIGPALVDISEC